MVSWAFCDAMFWGTKIQIASKDVSTLRSSMFISFSRKYTHTYQETETFRMITLTSMSSECNVSQAIIVPVQNKLRAPLLADHHRRRELCQRLLERLFDVRGALSNTQRKGGIKSIPQWKSTCITQTAWEVKYTSLRLGTAGFDALLLGSDARPCVWGGGLDPSHSTMLGVPYREVGNALCFFGMPLFWYREVSPKNNHPCWVNLGGWKRRSC